MRISNKTKTRLSLSRETLRTLTNGQLAQVAGGAPTTVCGADSAHNRCLETDADTGGCPSLPALCPTSNFTSLVIPVHQPGSP